MGCACSKPSTVAETRVSPNRRELSLKRSVSAQKIPRINSTRRDDGAKTNFPRRQEGSGINSMRREEGYRLDSMRRDEGSRMNSMRRDSGVRLKPKFEVGDAKILYYDRKINGFNRVHDDQTEKKKRELLEAVAGNHPGKGSVPKAVEGEQVAAGWPAWLSAAAGEAIRGWVPRRAETFEKLEKIGQGTYSSVYKARDIIRDKIVALKKVRFDNLDAESVKFMAREIHILRRLNHPNVIKLEGLITSPKSSSLYLVFEYMEHDLTGLASRPGVKFTEPQVKCFMQQLLQGLDYCHSRGVLHRDIKGSNLLINDDGILKIADFGLANFFDPQHNAPLTSRVVTLWYRPPELLLGATNYGVAVDLWSTGCILAELYTGKPILPGKTEVEQLHKIFKLCGSPSDDYWRKLNPPHSTAFKPAQPYRRCVTETFREFPASAVALVDNLLSIDPVRRGTAARALRSEFFLTAPFACDPSSLPKYPPSKEIDAKMQAETAKRTEKESGKDRKVDLEMKQPRESRVNPAPNAQVEEGTRTQRRQGHSSSLSRSELFKPRLEDPVTVFLSGSHKQTEAAGEVSKESRRVLYSGPLVQGHGQPKFVKEHDPFMSSKKANSVTLPNSLGSLMCMSEDPQDRANYPLTEVMNQVKSRTTEPKIEPEFMRRQDEKRNAQRASGYFIIENEKPPTKEPVPYLLGHKGKKIYVSGPLLGPSNNVDKMLEEHDRQIQEFARHALHGKVNTALKKTSTNVTVFPVRNRGTG